MQDISTKRRGGIAVALIIVACLLHSGLSSPQADAATRRRDDMLALTNESRARNDRAALDLNAALSRYATSHSRQMADKGYLFHTDDLAARLKGLDWSIAGENVGVGSSLPQLEGAFMRSKPHRENILRRTFDHAAVGVVRDGDQFWVTVIFYG